MPKSIMLETRTVNFLELVGNGKQYAIPAFQRDYSWCDEQWDDLWNDLLALHRDPKDRHYMGAIVVEAKNDREFLVIEGQQRLATLSTLSLVIIGRLIKLADEGIDSDANRERAASLRTRFVGEKDPASLIEKSKLALNETDDSFYQDYLVQLRKPLNPRALPRSNKLLWDCFQWFEKRLESQFPYPNDGKTLAEFLHETIARQLLFIHITVDDDLNAYTVFETLNARGLELSSTDLLKNYLFSCVKTKSDLKVIQRRWQKLLATVRQERFPEFLRYHLLCDQPQIRSNRLFKIVRDKIQSTQHVIDLMNSLESRSELFAALVDAAHDYWIDEPACKPLIRERILLKAQQSVPLMFAVWERLSKEDFARVLKLVNVFTFRFTAVSGLNTNELEPLFHRAAKAVLDGNADTPAKVFDFLRPSYVEDEQFRRNFEVLEVSTSGPSKHLAKYILCRFERDLSGRDTDYETDPGTIEHILPENPVDTWCDVISEREWPRQINRIGNLTLLEGKLNREIGNESFSKKISIYEKSRYELTKSIVSEPPEDWTTAQIEGRQNILAIRAVHLWRSDFA
jgi:Protein of unknown function DUF262/Protein of unknown function (DUF1524)